MCVVDILMRLYCFHPPAVEDRFMVASFYGTMTSSLRLCGSLDICLFVSAFIRLSVFSLRLLALLGGCFYYWCHCVCFFSFRWRLRWWLFCPYSSGGNKSPKQDPSAICMLKTGHGCWAPTNRNSCLFLRSGLRFVCWSKGRYLMMFLGCDCSWAHCES